MDPTRRYACWSWNYQIGLSGASFERAMIGSVPYPANRICPSRSMTRWKGSMRHFRSPFCGRSSTRAADLARKSGRLRGFLKFAPPRESRCAATTLLEQASRRRKRPYAGLMKTLAAPSRIHTRSRAHSASAKRTIGDALERDSCRRNIRCLCSCSKAGRLAKAGASGRRILCAALRTDGVRYRAAPLQA